MLQLVCLRRALLRKRLSFLILFVFISTFLLFPPPNFAEEPANTAGDIQLIIAIVLIAIIFLYAALKVVKEYERLVVFRLGHLIGARGPGLILLIPEVITKDNGWEHPAL